jgi:hypothetical protein
LSLAVIEACGFIRPTRWNLWKSNTAQIRALAKTANPGEDNQSSSLCPYVPSAFSGPVTFGANLHLSCWKLLWKSQFSTSET